MIRNKKFAVILVGFIVSATLLTGCGVSEGGETLPEENSDITDSSGLEDYAPDQEDEVGMPDQGDEIDIPDQSEDQSQTGSTITGILEAADADSITITDEGGEELVINITGDSEIQIGDTVSTPEDLAGKIGSEVNIEYDAETETAMVVSIKE